MDRRPLIVQVVPLRPEDYSVAHRVFRDVRDWGHDAAIDVQVDAPDITLIVWYEDATGIQIHYNGRTISGLKDLRLLLHSARLPHPEKN